MRLLAPFNCGLDFHNAIQITHLRRFSNVGHHHNKAQPVSKPRSRLYTCSYKDYITNSKTLRSLSEIYDKDQLIAQIRKLPISPFTTFLGECISHNFNISNNLWLSFRKMQKNSVEMKRIDWAYIYQFRFNQSQVGILNFNSQWRKIYDKEMVSVYNSSYVCWLLNTNQMELACQYAMLFLKESEIPLSIVFMILTRANDPVRLETVFDLLSNKPIDLPNELWTQILQLGLETNNYTIVKEVYKRYIMEGFSGGKITLEEAVLSLMPATNKVFDSMTNSLLMQVLQVFATHGDTTLTIDLIESHFFHKIVAGGTALNKEFCVKIIESHCYNADSDHESFENILDLIDVFAQKDVSGGIVSADLFQAMNSKFADYNTISGAESSDAEVVIPKDEKDNLSLARTSVLHDFVVQTMEYVQRLHPKTRGIFTDCLLNYAATYLNHSSIVQTLSALQYTCPATITELNELDFDSILYSLSKSSSKRCALHYLKYLKSIGIKPSPQMYSWMLNCTLRGHYESSVIYFLKSYYQDHDSLIGPMIQTVKDLPDNGKLGKLKHHLLGHKSLDLNHLFDVSEDDIFSKAGPVHPSKYYEAYDLKDLAKLETIFPIS
ncbi:hypothetical protein CANMA_000545 [Candida margitis]|uniref:uncharacterized protein n=1 Tax=Candida margitis TaxID=1775924 RepID=UPI002226B090|nr:uncharacterized protein CANMA_000545 [Candida margitis]KAI5970382.1 hypothetical protein CANMA_000545 [Candida margitis]